MFFEVLIHIITVIVLMLRMKLSIQPAESPSVLLLCLNVVSSDDSSDTCGGSSASCEFSLDKSPTYNFFKIYLSINSSTNSRIVFGELLT